MQTFDNVFTFDNLYEASRNCLKGVRWKPSTQRYESQELLRVNELYGKLKNGTYKQKPFYEFEIVERGKHRDIKSLHITDRVVQKCFCDEFLIKQLSKKLIYDNSACLKNKGVSFARKRIKTHLRQFLNKHENGYVLCFDFKNYFGSISHEILKRKVEPHIKDKKLFKLYCDLVNVFGNGRGLGLGSQISQISALFYMNDLDQFIKHNLKIEYYARYMDDGYLIHESKEYLQHCLKEIMRICEENEIQLSVHKTQIIKISKGFTFLKRRYIISKTSKIILKPVKDSFNRMKRKIRKLKNRPQELRQSFNSWLSSIIKTNCWLSLNNIRRKMIC